MTLRLSLFALTAALALSACGSGDPAAALAAGNDVAQVDAGQVVVIGLLRNDTAPTGGTLRLQRVGEPSCGTVTSVDEEEGEVTFLAPDQTGSCTFTYTVSAGAGATATAIVTVSVTGASGPTAQNDTATTAVGQPVTINVLANDSGSGLRIVSFSTTTLNGGAIVRTTTQQLRYTPAAGYVGLDTFSYLITDANGLTSTADVTVTVQ